MRLGPHTVTVVRAATKASDYGTTTVADWDNPTRTTVPGASVQPSTGTEYTTDRDSTQTSVDAWLPGGTDVLASDRVEWAGSTYDVVGPPEVWNFPPLSHVVVHLARSQEAL